MPEAKKFYEHNIAKRKPGESFTFQPLFNQNITEDFCGILTDIKPFEYEQIGSGEVQVWIQKMQNDMMDNYETPAGPIEPVHFQIELPELSPELLAKVTATILYKDIPYHGIPSFDDAELMQNGKATLQFYKFSRFRKGTMPDILFPQTADFQNINYVINNNGTRHIPNIEVFKPATL